MNLPLNIDIQQILLHMFNFVLLVAGLYFILYKPVKDFMDQRVAYYEKLDKEALGKQEAAVGLQADYEKRLAQVEQEILDKKVEAAKELESFKAQETKHAKELADKILEKARIEAEKEKEKALLSAQKELADMAAKATEKMVYASVLDAFDGFLSTAEGSSVDE